MLGSGGNKPYLSSAAIPRAQDPTNYLQHPLETFERLSVSSIFCTDRSRGETWAIAASSHHGRCSDSEQQRFYSEI